MRSSLAKAMLHGSSAWRGGRYPVRTPGIAVGPAGRLRCDARITRPAAMPLAAALNAPPLHGFSPVRPLRARPAPCAAALLAAPQVARPGYRPPRGDAGVARRGTQRRPGKAAGGCAPAATLRGAEDRRAHGRARAVRASTSDSRRLFKHSERSEWSEFRRGPCDRGPQGIRSEAEDAVHERRRSPARGFAPLGPSRSSRNRPR
jgi:hypothetical protein